MKTNQNGDHPDPLEEALDGFRGMVIPDPPPDQLVLNKIDQHRDRPPSPKMSFSMNTIARVAVAAAILVAAGVFLATNGSNSIALAEVIEETKKHSIVRYTMNGNASFKNGGTFSVATSTIYVDLTSPRLRTDTGTRLTVNDTAEDRWVIVSDISKDRLLKLHWLKLVVTEATAKNARQAKIAKSVLEDALGGAMEKREAWLYRATEISRESSKPFSDITEETSFLETLRELKNHDDVIVIRDKVGERNSMKYRLELGTRTTSLWVDVTSKLPVRIEHEFVNPVPEITLRRWVYTDFVWDPKGAEPEKLFSTVPPKGFTLDDRTETKIDGQN